MQPGTVFTISQAPLRALQVGAHTRDAEREGIVRRQLAERVCMEVRHTGACAASVPTCFFVSDRGSFFCTVVEAPLPGSRHPNISVAQNHFDWAVFDALEPGNRARFSEAWLWANVDFGKRLSNSELHTIMSYLNGGDMLVNAHLMSAAGLKPCVSPCPAGHLGTHWFLRDHIWGSARHLLFAQQTRRVFPHAASDDEGLAAEMARYQPGEWSQVLDAYARDLTAILHRAPRLDKPTVVYRGEQRHNKGIPYKDVPLAKSCSGRFLSCTLDASSAAFFARQHSHTAAVENVGTLYRILLPAGTPVACLAGMQTWAGVFECECLLPPVAAMRETGRHTLRVGATEVPVVDVEADFSSGVV